MSIFPIGDNDFGQKIRKRKKHMDRLVHFSKKIDKLLKKSKDYDKLKTDNSSLLKVLKKKKKKLRSHSDNSDDGDSPILLSGIEPASLSISETGELEYNPPTFTGPTLAYPDNRPIKFPKENTAVIADYGYGNTPIVATTSFPSRYGNIFDSKLNLFGRRENRNIFVPTQKSQAIKQSTGTQTSSTKESLPSLQFSSQPGQIETQGGYSNPINRVEITPMRVEPDTQDEDMAEMDKLLGKLINNLENVKSSIGSVTAK